MRWMCAAVVVLAVVGDSRAQPAGLLVVTPSALRPALAEFLEIKGAILPTECVDLERVLADTPGADDPEKLKRYLFDRWNAGRAAADGGRAAPTPLGYVLLVGDADIMPVRYMVLDRNTDAAFHYAFYPSDLYYADLARADGSFESWNAMTGAGPDGTTSADAAFHARYYGEVRGEHFKDDPINFDRIDYKPEIGVGRWPVSTPEQATVIAAKTIAYEKSLANLRSSRVALIASGGWIENRPAMDQAAATLGPAWEVQKRYWGRESGEGALPPPDEANVIDLLNGGVQFILHSGHGSDGSWHGAISTGSIARLHNETHPAIMMSAGCSTARLATLPPYEAYVDTDGREHAGTDHGEVFRAPPPPPAPYQSGKFNPAGLGEELLRAGPTGAVAYIGCNTGSQPCGMSLVQGLAESIARRAKDSDPIRLGDCWKDAEAYYFDHEQLDRIKPTADWYPASIFFQGMKFMLYGDPSLPVPISRG